ncbi:MAG: right-handed parallel beta-helix repeat-containing protein, partial [Verrucomicrobia bacterium]|nr:right-handed parallel beta-helix repeat-containing protein [Verrucomicrobiota bacterium]
MAFFWLIGNEFSLQLRVTWSNGSGVKFESKYLLLISLYLLLVSGVGVFATEKIEFFVAVDGNDDQPGSKSAPFASLQRARDAVRKVDRAGGREIRVWLRAGIYRLEETVVFSLQDSAGPGSRVVYASYPGEKAVLSGAALLPGEWKKTDRLNVWQIDVPESWPRIRALFDDQKMLPVARSEGVIPLRKAPDNVPYRFRRAIDLRHLYLPRSFVKKIGDFTGADIELIPKFPWVMNRLSVESVDAETGLLRTVEAATYPMLPPPLAYFPEGTLWVENVLAVLDEPGEWVFDAQRRKLYLWPLNGKKPGPHIVVGRKTELIAIRGEVDPTDLKDRPVTGLSFHGLAFTQGNGFAWEADKLGRGLQHDWEMYDEATAMVRLRGAENCTFTQCEFIDSAAAGIRLDLHCQRNEIRRCEFSNLGGVGLLMAGYGLGMKDVNRDNVLADSGFHHIGRLWKHSPAIFIWQSGHNRIVHNQIHHVPYTAIVVSGRTQLDRAGNREASRTVRWDEVNLLLEGEERTWQRREPLMHGRFNTIAYNEIHHCMEEMGDGNAIYVSGTGKGNHVHHNFIHDVTSPNMNAAIRCDDDQHAVLIEKNVIARCCGEGIISKGKNDIINNFVYDL